MPALPSCPIILPPGAGPFSITFNAVNTAATDPLPQTSPVQCTSTNVGTNTGIHGQAANTPVPPPTQPSAARRDSRASSVVSYATARNEPAVPQSQQPNGPDQPTNTQPPQSSQEGGCSNPPPTSQEERARAGGTNGVRTKTYWCAEAYRAKIRSIPGERTEWYESRSTVRRDAPPAPIRRIVRERRARAGCLHIHKHDNGRQAWMLDKCSPPRRASGSGAQARDRTRTDASTSANAGADERASRRAGHGEAVVKKERVRKAGDNLVWVPVDTWTPHPRLKDVVLHFLPNGEPRWAKESSVMQYKKDWREHEHATTDLE
ncbi:hypothetical protein C8Q70DRAFT_270577 [Cubamyces menziesii]|nr:hypothetical protein C8Q70DRAFT_270577 [Cubamyces menziesii]